VAPLPFNMTVMEFLADHRTAFLTRFFLAATFFGNVSGFVLAATLIYVAWNKQLAVRLAALLLLTSSLNSVLKLIIRNPRPFIREGTYLKKWAVSAKSARELATEYSTPSGHAMTASAFYSFLFAFVRNGWVRVLAVLAIVLIGLSRPYLGVHYLEDVLIGWAIGLFLALVSIRYAAPISAQWSRLSYGGQVGITVVAGLALWLLAVAFNGWRIDGQPGAAFSNAGLLTGIAIARHLELRIVNFDPRSSNLLAKALRYILSLGMMICTLLLLDKFTGEIAVQSSLAWDLLQYLRFAAAGISVIFLAPWLFTSLGLAKRTPIEAD
jgi:membrane-associated phospholipid phosphatase